MGHQVKPARGSVTAVMDCLSVRGPGVEALAAALTELLPTLPQAASLGFVVNADRVSLWDENWSPGDKTCFVVGGGAAAGWMAAPETWASWAAVAAGERKGGVRLGRGCLPGGLLMAGGGVTPWFALPIAAAEQLLAVVVVAIRSEVPEADLAATGECLAAVQRALAVVVGGWSENRALSAALDIVRQEVQSLSRLKQIHGRFMALAAHEFKTPLTSITAYTEVLRQHWHDAEFLPAGEFLTVIGTEADRLLRMVTRMLDFAGLGGEAQLMALTPTDLGSLVEATVRGLQPAIQAKQLQVEVVQAESVPAAVVDADLVQQVLVNLIGNAVKFTPPDGRVVVTISEGEAAVVVSVADNGPGIPAADMRRIFREFYRADGTTRRQEGSGLGLAIVQHIVSLHGGHVDVSVADGGGAEFCFTVPKVIAVRGHEACAEHQVLCDELVRLIAEMTGSLAVALMLPDTSGAVVPAAVMGWSVSPEIESGAWQNDASERLVMHAALDHESGGMVMVGRRQAEGGYGPADADQLSILAEVARVALATTSDVLPHAVEAVRLLRRIRQTGVPTATPAALALVAGLAHSLGLTASEVRRLQYAAALHDAGMARVEDEIVLGVAHLNIDERDEVERHVERGVDLMSPLLPDGATRAIIRCHHERFDGHGYPAGLQGKAIPRGARLLAVVDAWYALTSPRRFRPQMAAAEAMSEISSHTGTQFDPEVVSALQALLITEGVVNPVPDEAGQWGNQPHPN